MRRRGLVTVAVLLLAIAASASARPAHHRPAHHHPARRHHHARPWTPRLRDAVAYAEHRRAAAIAISVCTVHYCEGWHQSERFYSASLLKPILLVAYLQQRSVANRPLRSSEADLLTPMIERSDNAAASTVLGLVGTRGLYEVAVRARMHSFTAVTGIWGLSRIDADDQARFFRYIDRLVPARHRAFAMHLLASITPSQRWGIGRLHIHGWRLYFKGGWGSGTGWVDHQSALLVRGRARVSLSILTYLDPSHAYGQETLERIAARLLRGLSRARRVQ